MRSVVRRLGLVSICLDVKESSTSPQSTDIKRLSEGCAHRFSVWQGRLDPGRHGLSSRLPQSTQLVSRTDRIVLL